MHSIPRIVLFLGGAFISGCSQVPSLEQTTGTEDSPIFVTAVVSRVRCEIADAFADKFGNPKYEWVQNWTAKADLTLTLNESAGLAPSVAATKIFNNAPNIAAGPSSLAYNPTTGVVSHAVANGAYVIASIPQTLNWGAGGTFNASATRTEAISFTLAVKDLVAHSPGCGESRVSGLIGGLGLREWVDSVVEPVVIHELDAGDHPAPGSAGSVSTPSPKAASAKVSGRPHACGDLRKRVTGKAITDPSISQAELTASFSRAADVASAFADKANSVLTKAKNLYETIQSRQTAIKLNEEQSRLYRSVLNPQFQEAVKKDTEFVDIMGRYAKKQYDAVVAFKLKGDDLKSKIMKISTKDANFGQRDLDSPGIFKAELVKCGEPSEQQKGLGCGVLDCSSYINLNEKLKDTSKELGEPEKKAYLDPDYKACGALDAHYKVWAQLHPPAPPETLGRNSLLRNWYLGTLRRKNSLKKLESLDEQLCLVNDIKDNPACRDMKARKELSESCSAVLDFYEEIKGVGEIEVSESHEFNVDIIDKNVKTLDLKFQRIPAPSLPDPPIDSISHQVTFVVTYGAGVSPNWSLATFKGPGVNGNLASANGTRTHLLTLSLGPVKGSAKVSREQDRSIQNLNILSLGQPK